MSSTKSTSRLLSNVNAEYEIKAVLWTAVKLDAWSLIAITPRFGTPSADSGVSDLRRRMTLLLVGIRLSFGFPLSFAIYYEEM